MRCDILALDQINVWNEYRRRSQIFGGRSSENQIFSSSSVSKAGVVRNFLKALRRK
jgi:hypothetical protein